MLITFILNSHNAIAWDRTQWFWPNGWGSDYCRIETHHTLSYDDINAYHSDVSQGWWQGYEEVERYWQFKTGYTIRCISNTLKYNGAIEAGYYWRCPKYYQNLDWYRVCDYADDPENPFSYINYDSEEDISEPLYHLPGTPSLMRQGQSGAVFWCSAFEDG